MFRENLILVNSRLNGDIFIDFQILKCTAKTNHQNFIIFQSWFILTRVFTTPQPLPPPPVRRKYFSCSSVRSAPVRFPPVILQWAPRASRQLGLPSSVARNYCERVNSEGLETGRVNTGVPGWENGTGARTRRINKFDGLVWPGESNSAPVVRYAPESVVAMMKRQWN